MESLSRKVNVLLVENDPGDQKLIKGAILSTDYRIDLKIVSSAEAAIDYLQDGLNNPIGFPMPGLILLDLNMPGMGGKGFLKTIKADENFCSIPVVIVTSSDSQDDIEECYEMHAAGYIQKSASPQQFGQIFQKLARYWFLAAAALSE